MSSHDHDHAAVRASTLCARLNTRRRAVCDSALTSWTVCVPVPVCFACSRMTFRSRRRPEVQQRSCCKNKSVISQRFPRITRSSVQHATCTQQAQRATVTPPSPVHRLPNVHHGEVCVSVCCAHIVECLRSCVCFACRMTFRSRRPGPEAQQCKCCESMSVILRRCPRITLLQLQRPPLHPIRQRCRNSSSSTKCSTRSVQHATCTQQARNEQPNAHHGGVRVVRVLCFCCWQLDRRPLELGSPSHHATWVVLAGQRQKAAAPQRSLHALCGCAVVLTG